MTKAQPTKASLNHTPHASQATLLDHLHELRTRLFWIVAALILATSASYLIKDHIMAVIMQPLGGQRLVYLTPIGGFNFIFKVSLYVGLALILPALVYHLYRFLEPLMRPQHKRSVVFYMVASFLLAVAGGSFAYFAGLPAALHFLTGFDIQNVSAMLTVESYLAFVVTYVLGFAVLFQIPLILMIINTISPLPPKKLLGFMRFVILGAFIAAAIISPTPDATNQALLAVPIILMYVVGVIAVWVQSRAIRSHHDTSKVASTVPLRRPVQQPVTASPLPVRPLQPRRAYAAMDMTIPQRNVQPRRQSQRPARPLAKNSLRTPALPQSRPVRTPTSIDGIISRSQPLSQAG